MNPVAAPSSSVATKPADPALRKAAEAFEAVILREMMATMRKAKLGDDIFGSSATDNFREIADARTADSIAALRQFGIADMVERQLTPSPFASSAVEMTVRSARPNGVSTMLDTNGEDGNK
jgi:peptidoglycan hydrolase FlgJ